MTNPEHVDALREHRPLDALVNNAGIAVIGPLEYLPLDELRHQLEVNTIAQLAVIQACLPALRRARGRIVNVSSISGRVALPLYGPYAASKFALRRSATRCAASCAARGVHVSLIEPGAVATPIWERGRAATRMGSDAAGAARALWRLVATCARWRWKRRRRACRRERRGRRDRRRR